MIIRNLFCRSCGFLWSQHPNGTVDNVSLICVVIMIGNEKAHPDCKCFRFFPISNLEYLEKKYEK